VPRQTDLICTPQRRAAMMPYATQNGGYLRGCDGSSVTFRDDLGASIHPQGDGMTHSGVMAAELVRSSRLFAGARMLTPPGLASLIFTPGACLSMTRAGHCPG
jgi:hypothetical protein